MKIPDDMKTPAVAMAAGAAGALVVGIFAPPALLLGVGAAAAAGVCLYNHFSGKKDSKDEAGGETIDVPPEDVKEKQQ